MKIFLSFFLTLLVCALVWQKSLGFPGISSSFSRTSLSLISSSRRGIKHPSRVFMDASTNAQPEGFKDSNSYLAYLETQAKLPQVLYCISPSSPSSPSSLPTYSIRTLLTPPPSPFIPNQSIFLCILIFILLFLNSHSTLPSPPLPYP
ncbi:hypothetical protein EON65_47020, partial [archaeon]